MSHSGAGKVRQVSQASSTRLPYSSASASTFLVMLATLARASKCRTPGIPMAPDAEHAHHGIVSTASRFGRRPQQDQSKYFRCPGGNNGATYHPGPRRQSLRSDHPPGTQGRPVFAADAPGVATARPSTSRRPAGANERPARWLGWSPSQKVVHFQSAASIPLRIAGQRQTFDRSAGIRRKSRPPTTMATTESLNNLWQ